MTTWHKGPLLAFDLETTGVDVETARIVTCCLARLDGSGHDRPDIVRWLVDPGVEIPAEASEVHGISTERARAEGQPAGPAVADIAGRIAAAAADGVPVVAYNAVYDLTVLDRELRRHGHPSLTGRGVELVVVDPYVLDKHLDTYRKGPRKLVDVCTHYQARIDGAHDAGADALAVARLAFKLAETYPHIATLPLPELHAVQVRAKRDQDRSFADYLRRKGRDVDGLDGYWPLRPTP